MTQNERKRRQVQRLAETAEPLLPETRPGPGRGHKSKAKTWHDHYGNSNVYLTRRIARDRPDILARMKAGEFASVRDAAREAGIVRAVPLVEQVLRLWEKATPAERKAIRAQLAIDVDE
jgi:hypothetical protein